jgi:hypothetical protein
MIKAGEVKDIQPNSNWLIFDIGFSNRQKTCALLFNDTGPDLYQYNEAVKKVQDKIKNVKKLNLVIEAPLSVAFDKNGNPKSRKIEKRDGKTRCWYVGPGSTVLLAATYFLRRIMDSNPTANIKLFEGFVSYKDRGKTSDHLKDVKLLRRVIMSPSVLRHCKEPHELKLHEDDILESAFKVAGMDFGIPPVIQATDE